MTKLNLSIQLMREAFETKCKIKTMAANYAALLESVDKEVTREEAMLWGTLEMIGLIKEYFKSTGVENKELTGENSADWVMGLYSTIVSDVENNNQ